MLELNQALALLSIQALAKACWFHPARLLPMSLMREPDMRPILRQKLYNSPILHVEKYIALPDYVHEVGSTSLSLAFNCRSFRTREFSAPRYKLPEIHDFWCAEHSYPRTRAGATMPTHATRDAAQQPARAENSAARATELRLHSIGFFRNEENRGRRMYEGS